MDILFSPYSLGAVPKSAMAEVERRTEELLRSSSFQRMLELEKKHKMERSRGAQALLPSPQLSPQRKEGPPPRPERSDSLFPHEKFLVVQPARRPAVLPPLSITIPHYAAVHGRPAQFSEGEDEETDEDDEDVGTPTNNEPFQKQVKFLAPEDDEDGMSEQSSICQSPSWEGYGQRKEKKREAERRKKEKEKAEKEAKAAKKRVSRLSKAPPPQAPPTATATRDFTAVSLTNADRSMSDPVVVTRHISQSPQSYIRPQDMERTVSADRLQQHRRYRPAVTEVLSGSGSSHVRHEGGGAAEEPGVAHYLPSGRSVPQRHDLRRSMSEGPLPLDDYQAPAVSTFKPGGQVCPPSASRSSMLRHISHLGSSNRASTVYQNTPSANQSQESLAGRHGYVGYQRAQAAERAMAGLADELVGSMGHHYPPSRSSSGHTQDTRRSSLTQDAKSAAMKLVGMRSSSSTRDSSSSQTDYLTFKAIPYSASVTGASPAVGTTPITPRSGDGARRTFTDERPSTSDTAVLRSTKGMQEHSAALDRPLTSHSSASSIRPSVAGSAPSNRGKKSRGLRDAAKAALSMSSEPRMPDDDIKTSSPSPPSVAARSRSHPRTSVYAEPQVSQTTVENASERATGTPLSSSVKPSNVEPHGGFRVSEGSSSSSAYEDGSPLPSPSTTPDTSRPQSAKDVPLATNDIPGENTGSYGLQDDERTLRQSLDSSKSSTPRMVDPEASENTEMGTEDRWSRKALPIEIDGDAQSFKSTVSNLDQEKTTQQVTSPRKERPGPLKLAAKATVSDAEAVGAVTIPPRSRKRGQTPPEGTATSPMASPRGDDGNREDLTVGPRGNEGTRTTRWSPNSRETRQVRASAQEETMGMRGEVLQQQEVRPRDSAKLADAGRRMDGGEAHGAPGSPQRDWTSGSVTPASSTAPSSGNASPHGLTDFQIPAGPFFTDLPGSLKYIEVTGEIPTSAGPPSPISLPSPIHPVSPRPSSQHRTHSAPTSTAGSGSAAPSRTSTPATRPSGIVPVSILKQPKNTSPPEQAQAAPQTGSRQAHVLSAIPKHMQLQAGAPAAARSSTSLAENRMAPIAKMFVECCSCKFYHDMPSKLYECMAKPDAVVEDRLRGISGAITTMVKCPWCQHNMSRDCCAGYAAVVYLKEKLH